MKSFSMIRQQLRLFGLNPEHWCMIPTKGASTYEFQHRRIPHFKLLAFIDSGQIKNLEIAGAYW